MRNDVAGMAVKRKRARRIPVLRRTAEPNAITLAALDDALNGRDVHGPFDSVEALMADLNAED